jgi:hypothetical protein
MVVIFVETHCMRLQRVFTGHTDIPRWRGQGVDRLCFYLNTSLPNLL